MSYRYHTCDVFTTARFGGNPLAVLPHADGLSDRRMQQIAREFNYSETSFVFPATGAHTRRVRIFTPAREVPFAGHPNVGTAFVLATIGELGGATSVTFEEEAGPVAISIDRGGGGVRSCEVAAPQPLSLGETVPAPLVAGAVSLDAGDLVTERHPPRAVSVGLPFLMTELKDRSALERARINAEGFDAIAAQGIRPSIYLYTRADGDCDLRVRMFAPQSGVPEDPATGSAACAVAGLLAHLDGRADGGFRWRIVQGVEMGRPSALLARAEKKGGTIRGTWVGGACVTVAEGSIEVD
ncbi:MAG TPA: PhzF family phenazine biosynthesis protein [Candidatus Eisenbacteria bacterium]